MRIRVDFRPDTADQYRTVPESVRLKELSVPVLSERSDEGRSQRSHLTVEKVHAPLVTVRVVQEQSHRLPVSFRTVSLDFLEPRLAAPDLPRGHSALQGHGDIRLTERVRCPRNVGVPSAFAEIEIMQAIAQWDGLSSGSLSCGSSDEAQRGDGGGDAGGGGGGPPRVGS